MTLPENQEAAMLIGIAAIACALVLFINTRKFVRNAIEVQGEVVNQGYDQKTSSTRQLLAAIHYKVGDKTYSCSARVSSRKKYAIGKKVSVLYDKENPGYGQVNSVGELYFFEIVCAVVGIFTLLGLLAKHLG